MEGMIVFVFLLLLIIVVVYVVSLQGVTARLQEAHPEVWDELGAPTLLNIKLRKFIGSYAFSQLGDKVLLRRRTVARLVMGFFVISVALIALAFLLLLSVR